MNLRLALKVNWTHVAKYTILIIGLIAILVILLGPEGEICDKEILSSDTNCSIHNLVFVLLWQIGDFLVAWSPAVVAIATVVVAFFTYTLWRSTNQLSNAAIQQGRDTQESLAISRIAAEASKKSAGVAEAHLLATRPWIERAIWINGPLTMNIASDTYRSLGIDLKVVLSNKGDSPALDVGVFGFLAVDQRAIFAPESLFIEPAKSFAVFYKNKGMTIHAGESTPEMPWRISGKVPDNFSLASRSRINLFLGVTYRIPFGNFPSQYEVNKIWISDLRPDEQMVDNPAVIDKEFMGAMLEGNYSGDC